MRISGFVVAMLLAGLAATPSARADSILRDAALSPNGRLLALELVNGERHVVAISDNDAPDAPARMLDIASREVTNLRWADDGFLLIHTTQRGPGRLEPGQRRAAEGIEFRRGGSRGAPIVGVDIDDVDFTSVYALDAATMRAVQLLGDTRGVAFTTELDDVVKTPGAPAGVVIMRAPVWLDDNDDRGGTITGGDARVRDGTDPAIKRAADSLWRVDLRTGRGEILERGSLFTTSWIVDGAGAAVARMDRQGTTPAYRMQPYAAGKPTGPQISVTFDAGVVPVFRAVRADGRTAEVTLYPEGGGEGRIVLLDVTTGAMTALDGGAAGAPMFDERSGLVSPPRTATMIGQLAQAFGGAHVALASSAANGDRHVVRARSADKEEWFLYSDTAKSAELIGVGAPPTP